MASKVKISKNGIEADLVTKCYGRSKMMDSDAFMNTISWFLSHINHIENQLSESLSKDDYTDSLGTYSSLFRLFETI